MDIRRFAPFVAGRRAGELFIPAHQAPQPAGTPAPRHPGTPAAPADRKYLLERVDDAAVVQLYADGFSSLPLKQKTLIWHLYQAALAGRDIFIDQKHRDALEMRGVIEQIVAHPQGVDAATLAEIQRYTKLFWINNGPYNNLTARKFVLTLHAAGVRRGGEGGGGSGRDVRDAARANRSTRCWRGCSRCSSTRTSIRSSPTRRPAPARTSCRRAPTTSTPACRWPTSRASPRSTASTRGW